MENRQKLIDSFLQELRGVKGGMHCSFGIEALNVFIRALEKSGTKTKEWDTVALFVLAEAEKGNYFHYPGILLSLLSKYTSVNVCERIVEILVRFGSANRVLEITHSRLERSPTREEVFTMATFHQKNFTSSCDSVWQTLRAFVEKEDLGIFSEIMAGTRTEISLA